MVITLIAKNAKNLQSLKIKVKDIIKVALNLNIKKAKLMTKGTAVNLRTDNKDI